ncbi:DUF6602 domain-containing protein [Priestia sp. FSL W8-0524]|uniref:DUF6602 domain-containing protein n=1 Tax=Priestia sp. FSL W8-0524 TaxID=2954625 RepID=UPI0030FB8ED4
MEEFLEVLRFNAKELKIQFEKSSIEGKSTSQEVSDFREQAVQQFVRRYYPFPYQISKGGIYDSYGTRSDSIDCLILNPNHPHTVNHAGKHSLIIADGLDVAIEVKPDVANRQELYRGLVQGISVKKLRRRNSPLLVKSNHPEYIQELSRQIPFFIFSMKSKNNINDTIQEIKAYYEEHKVPIVDQIDALIINDKGILVNFKYQELYPFNTTRLTTEEQAGWFFEEWGADTLGGFLFHLDRVFGASSQINDTFLKYYVLSKKIPTRSV